VSAIGAFVVGVLGNLYSRAFKGTAFTAMVTGILFLVPVRVVVPYSYTFLAKLLSAVRLICSWRTRTKLQRAKCGPVLERASDWCADGAGCYRYNGRSVWERAARLLLWPPQDRSHVCVLKGRLFVIFVLSFRFCSTCMYRCRCAAP